MPLSSLCSSDKTFGSHRLRLLLGNIRIWWVDWSKRGHKNPRKHPGNIWQMLMQIAKAPWRSIYSLLRLALSSQDTHSLESLRALSFAALARSANFAAQTLAEGRVRIKVIGCGHISQNWRPYSSIFNKLKLNLNHSPQHLKIDQKNHCEILRQFNSDGWAEKTVQSRPYHWSQKITIESEPCDEWASTSDHPRKAGCFSATLNSNTLFFLCISYQ